jgi:glucokinase
MDLTTCCPLILINQAPASAGPALRWQGQCGTGEVTLTNRGWHVSEQTLQTRFGFSDAKLINDFTAMARAVPEFEQDRFEQILPGRRSLRRRSLSPGRARASVWPH